MKFEETRLRLYQYFQEQLQQEKAKRSRKAIRFFIIFMIVAAISVVVNFAFDLQGLPFIVPAAVFLIWFFPIRYSGGMDSATEWEWMVKAMSGIPKEGAWHLYRMRKVMEVPNDVVNANERTRWLLHDVDLFLQRHPESELVRFYQAEFCSVMRWNADAAEAMDRVIEQDGAALLEAYKQRAEYLDHFDKAAAKQDRETVAQMERDDWKAPKQQDVDAVNPMDVALAIDPLPVFVTAEEARNLIRENQVDKALSAARDMESPYDTVHVFIEAAGFYHEQHADEKVSRVLSDAVKASLRQTESKSFRGSLLVRVAEAQCRLIGAREAGATLDLAVKENGQTRKEEARLSTYKKIIKAQLKCTLFQEAEKTIALIGDEDTEMLLQFELADALWKQGELVVSQQIREKTDKRIPDIDDRDYLWLILRAAQSYHAAGEQERCRKRLRDGMDLLKYSESDFHDDMAEVGEAYCNCDCMREFIEDIRQYEDEDIEDYISGAKELLNEQ